MKKISISSTMGPGVKIALDSVGQRLEHRKNELSGARSPEEPVRDRRRPHQDLIR